MSTGLKALIDKLNPVCKRALETAASLCVDQTHYNVEIEHFLVKLVEAEATDLTLVFGYYEIESSQLTRELERAIEGFERGNTRTPALAPGLVKLLSEAWLVASMSLGSDAIRSGAVLQALLEEESFRLVVLESCPGLTGIPLPRLREDLPELVRHSEEHELPATGAVAKRTAAPREAIFLCYRRGDSPDVTGRIKDHLVAQFGEDAVFTDIDGIPLGVDFRTHLDAVVSRCRVFLVVVGRDWFGGETDANRLEDPSDFVRIEIESALKREIPVIPVLVRGASMPNEGDLPKSLAAFAYRHGTRVRPDPDFSSDIARVISGLEGYLRS